RRPVYDIEALRTRLSLVERYPQATLWPENAKPRYAALPPAAVPACRARLALRAARPDGVPGVARRARRHVAVDGVAAPEDHRRRRRLHVDAGAARSPLSAARPRRHPPRRRRTAPGAVRARAARCSGP